MDGSMAGLGLIKTNIKIEVENGYATKITGGLAKKLKVMLDKVGKDAVILQSLEMNNAFRKTKRNFT